MTPPLGLSHSFESGRPRLAHLFPGTVRATALTPIVESLPDIGSATGFEIRLGDDGAARETPETRAVDLGVLLLPDERTRALLDDDRCGPAIDAAAWSRFRAFVARWLEPGSLLARRVPLAFLEFDCPDEAATPVAPCVFARLPLPWEIDERVDAASTLDTIDRVLDPLIGSDAARSRAITSILARLPADCRPFHVGAMLSRPDAVRLFTGLPATALAETLDRLDLGHYVDAAKLITEALDPARGWSQLQFDVASPSQRIGLEFNATSASPAEAPRAWSELLARLEVAGWCTPEDRRGLLGWPGHETVAGRELLFEISHIKLALSREKAIAKAYVSLRWGH